MLSRHILFVLVSLWLFIVSRYVIYLCVCFFFVGRLALIFFPFLFLLLLIWTLAVFVLQLEQGLRALKSCSIFIDSQYFANNEVMGFEIDKTKKSCHNRKVTNNRKSKNQ